MSKSLFFNTLSFLLFLILFLIEHYIYTLAFVWFTGTCVCSANFMGPSCSTPVGEDPMVTMPKTVLCDIRTEDCKWVQIFGKNFRDDSSIDFKVQKLLVRFFLLFSEYQVFSSALDLICFAFFCFVI